MQIWIYDSDLGQGSVEAETQSDAEQEARLDAGRDNNVRNVRQPTTAEMAFRHSMGGR